MWIEFLWNAFPNKALLGDWQDQKVPDDLSSNPGTHMGGERADSLPEVVF